jgi:hypothetical protein
MIAELTDWDRIFLVYAIGILVALAITLIGYDK